MAKVSMPVGNQFCPQTLFLYGTYDEEGLPNFGQFCWASYCWDNGLCFMAAIGEPKMTQDRIRANGVFSANLVTEDLLPLSDYLGNTSGRSGAKKDLNIPVEKGRILDVPILTQSPVNFELEVFKTIDLADESVVFLCRIRNVLHDESLTDQGKTLTERLAAIAPVRTTFETYYGWDGRPLGDWGQVQKKPQ